MSELSQRHPLKRFTLKRFALLTVIAGALFALPSSALASTPTILPAPTTYTMSGNGPLKITSAGGTSFCQGWSGSGEWNNAVNKASSTGVMNLTLTECKWLSLGYCTSSGQASGTIVASSLKANLIWIDKAHTKPGVLLSPPTETAPFANVQCPLVGQINWNGSIIAQITSPGLGQTAFAWKLSFAQKSAGVPLYTKVEEEGAEHRLRQGSENMAWTGEITMSFPEETKLQG